MNLESTGFKFTPKPRELTEEEINKFGLRCSYTKSEMKPAIETSTVIWTAAATEKDPVYRLYNNGTNNLLILEYNWNEDSWNKIECTEINNLYGLLWLMCVKLSD
jgi:hypothetical protein